MKTRHISLFIALALLAFLTTTYIFAQDYKGKGRLVGYVTDEDGNPLEGARIKLVCASTGTGLDVKTDQEGKWVAAWIRGGAWNIDIEKVGFATKKISVDVQEFKKNPEIKIALQKVEGLVLTDDMLDLLEKGNQLFRENKFDEARAVYEDILARYPDAYPVYRNVGNCWFAQEEYNQAEQAYMKVLEKDPDNVDAILAIGNCYANRGDTDKALEWYSKLEIDTITDPTVLYNIGTSYYNNGKFDVALKYYEKAVEKENIMTDALYQLGLTYLNLQRNAEAITTFERYLKLDADSARAAQVRSFLDYLKK